MATHMYLRHEDGKDYLAAKFEGSEVFNFYASQCRQRKAAHTISESGNVLEIANKVVFKLK